jgi:hypothetical protein
MTMTKKTKCNHPNVPPKPQRTASQWCDVCGAFINVRTVYLPRVGPKVGAVDWDRVEDGGQTRAASPNWETTTRSCHGRTLSNQISKKSAKGAGYGLD